MAETASDVIQDALQLILVQGSEMDIQPDEAQSALRFLNRMMNRLAVRGINLGYTELTSLGQTLTVPLGAIEGIVANLALAVAPMYQSPGVPLNPDVREQARQGLRDMAQIAVKVGPTMYPSTLPRGSGNDPDIEYRYFPGVDEEVLLDELYDTISIESDTVVP